jgi:hypothetical protein
MTSGADYEMTRGSWPAHDIICKIPSRAIFLYPRRCLLPESSWVMIRATSQVGDRNVCCRGPPVDLEPQNLHVTPDLPSSDFTMFVQ